MITLQQNLNIPITLGSMGQQYMQVCVHKAVKALDDVCLESTGVVATPDDQKPDYKLVMLG